MTRKDFELIAATINALLCINDDTRDRIAHSFASRLASTNPNFNRDRFIAACMKQSAERVS